MPLFSFAYVDKSSMNCILGKSKAWFNEKISLLHKPILFTSVDFGLPNKLCARGFVDFIYYNSCAPTLSRNKNKHGLAAGFKFETK